MNRALVYLRKLIKHITIILIKLLVKSLDIVIFLINCIILLISFYLYSLPSSYAQWILPPLPSADSDLSKCCINGLNSNDTEPPQITILTDTLYEDNNVFKVKILDDSPLDKRGISYSVGNNSITTHLAKDTSIVYKALIKVQFPSTKVDISALDIHGNYAKLIKEIKVEKGNVILATITNPEFWKNLIFWK
jgi:hypothetical protein